jgi:murein L,D-transpeptidase YafK
VYHQNKLLKSYKISLGFSPEGHKEKEGDGKTPEGMYTISHKNPRSQFHLSLKISYPSLKDKQSAVKKGVSPGGDIMIHGLGKDFSHLGKNHILHNWTLGCIALTDEEIQEIYHATSVGTIIKIET